MHSPKPLIRGLFFLLPFALLAVPRATQGQSAIPNNLAGYHNRNRVLLVFAPLPTDARYKRQALLLKGDSAGMRDRDLVRFNIFRQKGRALRQRYGIAPEAFRVLLIGKDGNTAFSASQPVTQQDLFERIDRMPMRRDEMRRRGH